MNKKVYSYVDMYIYLNMYIYKYVVLYHTEQPHQRLEQQRIPSHHVSLSYLQSFTKKHIR